MRPQPPLAVRLLRAAASLTALALLLVGVPVLLLAAGTLPGHVPGPSEISDVLQYDDGSSLFKVLTLAAWAFWGWVAASTVIEAGTMLRRRPRQRVRGFAAPQRLAAFLLGGLLVLPASTAMAASSPAVAATATHVPQQLTTQQAVTEQSAPTTERAGAVHVVSEAGETVWDIAETALGDGQRAVEIRQLNPELPTGATLPVGTTVKLPADARPTQAPAADTAARAAGDSGPRPTGGHTTTVTDDQRHDTEHVVKPGDTMWEIAEEEKGDGTKYVEIFEANEGAEQPGGTRLTNPADIRPGLKLTIPHASAPAEDTKPDAPKSPDRDRPSNDNRPAEPDTPGDSADDRQHGADEGAAKTPPKETEKPSAERDTAPSPSASGHESAPPSAAPSTKPAESETAETARPAQEPGASSTDESVVDARHIAGLGMLLAGTLAGTIAVKRLLQRRRRNPGETIAMPDTPGPVEQGLDYAAEPASVDLLDHALRTLAHHAAAHDRALPELRGARVTATSIELLLDDDAEPLPPFTRAGEHLWALDPAHQLIDSPHTVAAPYPGLVPLGTETDGSHLLLNLTHTRVLLLDGDDQDVRDTARVIALAAGTSAWSDHADILTVGLGTELPALLPQGRLRAVPSLRAAQSDLGELLLEHHQGDAPADPLPWMLICSADAIRADEVQPLAASLAAAHDMPVALVLPARHAAAEFPDAVRLQAGTDAPQHLDHLGTDLVLQTLPEEDYRAFLRVLHTADEPARPAEGAWRHVPPVSLTKTDTDNGPSSIPLLATVPDPTADSVDEPETPFAALTDTAPAGGTVHVLNPLPPTDEAPEDDHTEPATSEETAAAPPALLGQAAADETELPAQEAEFTGGGPLIRVLGPVEVTGVEASGHGPKLAALAALIYFKPGITGDTICDAMDPIEPWAKRTLQTRISELRNRLGSDNDGNVYLPRARTGGYRLSDQVRCDWTEFETLATRGLAKGETAGIADLTTALDLVTGRPFDGDQPTWAAARIQEMLVRITDVAHTLATWHRTAPRPNLDAARRAVRAGLDIDDSSELLYQDWMRIEDQAGNRDAVRTAYDTLLAVNRSLNVGTEPDTERVYDSIMRRTA
ncbi:LysM peptidoglycan-binding domain-containing protein [Streptomyces cavernicola]|uniref:LysM peptidoglycan-binding domain-containing protein n=1 Tax=Streptomyces cavernicola TaxID=3043613 RepID=A0ABT6SJI6_9ACTN|nr:LysM peptidoglycan-binding domain-containing protein [Streptomyces sp. B-S-A6]MDI3408357.1 LysM peptidoglycan-binding domain-containing protein [Streptomyces sp. B-S-A6]